MDPKFEAEAMLKGQAEIMNHMAWFTELMVLKCAIDLGLADIVHSHLGPISLSQLASRIELTTSPDTDYLSRIMRVLVRKNIFTLHHSSDGGEPLYGPTPASRYITRDAEPNMIKQVTFWSNKVYMAPFRHLAECVRNGGVAFDKADHGMGVGDFMTRNDQCKGMDCTDEIETRAFLDGYGDGFDGVGTLVDVGGGTGGFVGEIVKANSGVKGVNFELEHVIAAAPEREGVSHVSGDMFESIPIADAIIMKGILHEWNDEDCIKILKNCRASIPEKTGKVVIIDIVLKPYDDDDLFAETALVSDISMMAVTKSGKERTEDEWEKILALGGFPRYKITKIAAIPSIIEAFPN